MTFADLCCGSGALTIRLLDGPDATPPAPYMGGKRRWAAGILDLLGIRGERPDRIVMADSGPWGRFWRTVLVDDGPDVVARAIRRACRSWGADQAFYAWDEIRSEGVPADGPTFAARFLCLQAANGRARPVGVDGDKWVTAGYAHLTDSARRRQMPERLRPLALARKVEALGRGWPPVEVYTCDVREMPIDWAGPDAVAYIDPPYAGTTGYGSNELGREDVRAVAARLAAQGCTVAVSESEPLPWAGWHHAQPARSSSTWQPRTFAKTSEWLTMSTPPADVQRQQRLPLEAHG